MFQNNTSGEARVVARDGYNRMVFPHVRLFPHNISEKPSYSLPSTIRCTIAKRKRKPFFVVIFSLGRHNSTHICWNPKKNSYFSCGLCFLRSLQDLSLLSTIFRIFVIFGCEWFNVFVNHASEIKTQFLERGVAALIYPGTVISPCRSCMLRYILANNDGNLAT